MAEQQVVVRRQVEILTGSSRRAAADRLAGLLKRGYVRRENGVGERCWLIRRAGLTALGSELSPPQLGLASYRHSVGLAGLWLAAWTGAFGSVAEVVGERRIRAHDAAPVTPEELYSVRLGGYDATGHERRHYPDLLLIDSQGRRLALELELSSKRVATRQEILGAYGAARRLDGVLYLVEDNERGRSIARGVRATATRMELLDRVHIRRVTPILTGRDENPGRGDRGISTPGLRRRAGAARPPGASRTAATVEAGR